MNARAALLPIFLVACRDKRTTATVTINPFSEHSAGTVFAIKPIVPDTRRESVYLDDDVTGLRVQLIIKEADRQPSFTVRLYQSELEERKPANALAELRLIPPSYVRVVGDPWERNRIRGPDDPAPPPTDTAVELTIPARTFEHRRSYALELYGADARLVADYALTTN
jgi:hypothetical protein